MPKYETRSNILNYNDVEISLWVGFGVILNKRVFALKNTPDDHHRTVKLKMNPITELLCQWVPTRSNAGDHQLTFSYNQGSNPTLRIDIGSYTKNIDSIRGVFHLYEYLTDYIYTNFECSSTKLVQ
jgi:hypothetical protein